MIPRFDGTCEALASVDVAALVEWAGGIPFSDWPQQRPIEGQMRPAMVTDPAWHGFGKMFAPVVAGLMEWFTGCEPHQQMLSVVMPGHGIDSHRDSQAPAWRCRVHVPLMTNWQSMFCVGGVAHNLRVGEAYIVNTEVKHAVTNDGRSPRVHLMFDVRLKS